jgi:hypothetical protein
MNLVCFNKSAIKPKYFYAFMTLYCLFAMFSCSYVGPPREFDTEKGMAKLIRHLKRIIPKHGGYSNLNLYHLDDLYYWDVTFSEDIKNPGKQLIYSTREGFWTKSADLIVEPDQPGWYLISISDFDLMKLLPMFEKSKNKIIKEKGIKDVFIERCEISVNKKQKSTDILKAIQINIDYQTKQGKPYFYFTYDINGNLTNFSSN